MAKKVDKRMFKKEGEELQQYLAIMRKHNVVENKKGKGSYSRKTKHKKGNEE
jgi:stalled ribosome alternative rescue factor ArfA